MTGVATVYRLDRSSASPQKMRPGVADVTITDDSLTVTRRQAQIAEEAALDGIYVLRTPVPDDQLDAPGVVTAHKNLSRVERDFRSINPTTWTCGRSTTTWKNGSERTS